MAAIELPGEAAPLSGHQVYLALQSASSSQQQFIQTGTQQLQTWESQPGYHSLLQAAYLDKSLPTEIRYLAIIQLKNGIDKYWRKSAPNAIKAEEKAQIRSQILSGGLNEADPQLALQSALAVSKIVRIDYPTDWPEVLTSLTATLRSSSTSNQLHLSRGLLILLQIIKELATARLRRSQTSLQATTPELVYLLGEIYSQKVAHWLGFLNGNGEDEGGTMDDMENSLLALKILRRLLIAGYEYPNHNKEVQQLWAQSQSQFGQLLDLRSLEPPIMVSPAKELVEKHLIQLSKLHVEMSNVHPAAFALLPSSLELARAYWGLVVRFGDRYASLETVPDVGGKNGRDFMERLSLKGLTLLRACMKMVFSPAHSFKYRTPEIKEEQNQAVGLVKTQLLTDDLITQIAHVIVTKFFVFRPADLEAWEEEPDEWEIREEGGGDTWEFEVRPCAEKLFMDAVLNFKHLLVQPLLGFFHSVAATSQSDVVTKDSVYTAMGLSAAVVYKEFDFDSFLTSTLVNDVQQGSQDYKVLRRRIAILLGQWITVKIDVANRPLVYQIFQHLLNSQDEINDIVVRMTAARQFKAVVDDFGFEAEGFLPFATDILSRLMALIQEVDHTETKMAILDTIRTIAVRLEQHISPFADQIVSLLPRLWEASGEEHLMKQAILTLLSTLAGSMKEESQRYHPLILPLIQRAVETGSEMQVYLLDEALDLWATVLTQAPTPASPEVIAIIDSVFPLLELGSDNLRMALSVVDSYVLLAPEAMLGNTVRLRVLSHMTNLLGVTKRELAGLVTTVVEDMILAAEKLGGIDGVAIVVKDLLETGYTEKIMEGLRDAWEAHQTVGPDRRYPKVDDVVETDYFTVLARIALADPDTFVNFLASVGNVEETWSWLSTEWFRHFDSMANIHRLKLSCLALTRLLEVPPQLTSTILGRLQDYFAMWTSVVGEMQDGRDDGGDNLIWTGSEGYEYETCEDLRRRLQSEGDPVHKAHTLTYITARLHDVVSRCGGEADFERNWAVNVDRDVLASFQALSRGQHS
ncbi:MAG: hypothetical protein M1818_002100 [Claussenomyces sp. TS43310]|nr:MAG: hypothetical protein M1818_002100 [Claussenomyces sp. TS43310]